MTQCWPEGALRAYLDGELPSEDMQRVAAHLGDCTVCDGLCRELAARAAHVSALMELLPEWGAAMPRAAILARAPHRRGALVGLPPAPAEHPAQRRPRRVRPTAPEPAYFVALDDEPFESGVIMRVGVKPGNVQADIVFGPDGRAHAFRLVNATQRNF